jgi:hypothetical protein
MTCVFMFIFQLNYILLLGIKVKIVISLVNMAERGPYFTTFYYRCLIVNLK